MFVIYELSLAHRVDIGSINVAACVYNKLEHGFSFILGNQISCEAADCTQAKK